MTYTWNLKYDTNEPTYKTETDSQAYKTDFEVAKREWVWGKVEWEFGISRCKLLHIEQINNKVLLYSRDNYIQYPMKKYNRKEYKKDCIHMYTICLHIVHIYIYTHTHI